jgi:hypothetical protein
MPIASTAYVLLAAASQPNRRYVYWPAIWARFAITITSATMIPQPAIQPTHGPNAFVPHEKVVPQSGSTRLR